MLLVVVQQRHEGDRCGEGPAGDPRDSVESFASRVVEKVEFVQAGQSTCLVCSALSRRRRRVFHRQFLSCSPSAAVARSGEGALVTSATFGKMSIAVQPSGQLFAATVTGVDLSARISSANVERFVPRGSNITCWPFRTSR